MYQFNLEILRKYRKRQEEKIQKEFADCKVKLKIEEKSLNDLIKKRDVICNQKKNKINDEFKVHDNILFYQYIRDLDELIKNGYLIVEKTKKKYLELYEELKNAVKKRKMVDSLKEKGREVYLRKESKRDQKNLDEMGIISFQRNNVNNA